MGSTVGTMQAEKKVKNGDVLAENHPMGDDIGDKLLRVFERINHVELPTEFKDVVLADLHLVEKNSGNVSYAVRAAVHDYYSTLSLKDVTALIERFDEALVQIINFNKRKKADTRPVIHTVHQGVVRRGRR